MYSYPPVSQNIQNFPTIWQPATLLSTDTAGQALWSKIAGNIPNIAPKGQLNGSTINVTYDTVNDPDCCEWHFCSLAMVGGCERNGAACVVHVAQDMLKRLASCEASAWSPLT